MQLMFLGVLSEMIQLDAQATGLVCLAILTRETATQSLQRLIWCLGQSDLGLAAAEIR